MKSSRETMKGDVKREKKREKPEGRRAFET